MTLPVRMRERYALEDGDPVTLVDLDGVIVIAPRVGIVPKLAAEIQGIRTDAGLTVEDLVKGTATERRVRRGAGAAGRVPARRSSTGTNRPSAPPIRRGRT